MSQLSLSLIRFYLNFYFCCQTCSLPPDFPSSTSILTWISSRQPLDSEKATYSQTWTCCGSLILIHFSICFCSHFSICCCSLILICCDSSTWICFEILTLT